jgi:hypothetical protein
MSIVSESQAFISIGVSCQTAQQLQRHAGFLSSLLNDQLLERSAFFNWVFVSASDIAKVVERLHSGPIMPHSLYVPTHAQEALRLEDFKLWFWHEKLSDAVTQDDVERIAGKYERLRNRFLKMLEKPTRYIVLSNTQNNIEDFYPYQTQGMNISLDADIVSEIACAPWATNQYGRAEMIAVTYPRRWTGRPHPDVSYLEEDDTVWEGSLAHWDEALQRHLIPDLKPKKRWSNDNSRSGRVHLAPQRANWENEAGNLSHPPFYGCAPVPAGIDRFATLSHGLQDEAHRKDGRVSSRAACAPVNHREDKHQ